MRSWPTLVALLAIALASVFARLPFADVPVTADEGGYAYVAWFWSRGDALYTDLWVDRPQGLLLVYRAVFELLGTQPFDLRLGAGIYNAASVLMVAAITWRLLGRGAALASAALFAVLSALPQLEGFTLNGELLTTLPSLIAVALLVEWVGRRRTLQWRRGALLLGAAGVACGCSFLCKQSGIDSALALVLFVGVSRVGRAMSWRAATAAVATFATGAAVPLAASVAFGVRAAGDDYWYAVFGYRLTADSFTSEPLAVRIGMFAESFPLVVSALGGVAVLAAIGARWMWRRGEQDQLVVLWGVALLVGVVAGGQFHPHYYSALAPALGICAAAGTLVLRRAWRRSPLPAALVSVGLAAAMAAPVATAVRLATHGDARDKSWRVFGDARYLSDPEVGAWMREHSESGQRVLGMYAAADLYWHARRRSAYRYLWFRGIATIPGAMPQLRATLTDPRRRPELVAIVQPTSDIDRTGALRRILDNSYSRVATVNGVAIWRAD